MRAGRQQISFTRVLVGGLPFLAACASSSAGPEDAGGGPDAWTVGRGGPDATVDGSADEDTGSADATVDGASDENTGSAGADAEAGSGFVTASGTNLMLDGGVFRFIGFDAYGMTGCFNGTAWTTAQLDTYFAGLPANGMTRLWAFKQYGTAAISSIVTEAARYNQHLILSLGNDDGNCDPNPTDPNQSGEPLSFYQSGWQGSYLAWVNTIVPTFRDNTAVAMWEIANEPGEEATVPEATMQAYLSSTAAAIKAADPNHLVETGVSNPASVVDYQQAQSGPDIDVLSFHDYAWDYEAKAVESANFTAAQAAAQALGKPFIAGEAGVESGPTCTTDLTQTQRVTYLQSKTNDYFEGLSSNGTMGAPIAGVMFWEYEPVNTYGWNIGESEYDFFAGDPLVSMVQNYVVP